MIDLLLLPTPVWVALGIALAGTLAVFLAAFAATMTIKELNDLWDYPPTEVRREESRD